MAITQDYVNWATGNDYKGSTFTDGAFTVANMTLTKAGAFAASKANHWLYLDDNGSGNVTPGYYRIASVTSSDAVVLAASPKSGATDPTDVKCTQHTGTVLLPWRSDQGACDLCARNTTNGNQINVVAGSAVVHTAALDLTTFVAGGALGNAAPLILRGCTATANDGGSGEIDCGGATMFAAAYNYVLLVDLHLHTFGNNNGVVLGDYCRVHHCEVDRGASTPSGKTLVTLAAAATITHNYVHDLYSSSSVGIKANSGTIEGNYVHSTVDNGTAIQMSAFGATGSVSYNVVLLGHTSAPGIAIGYGVVVKHNGIYNTTAGTRNGIELGSGSGATSIINNILVGFSGAGVTAIGHPSGPKPIGVLGYNAFYNNTANNPSWPLSVDLTANDVALAADPFSDAANGDFSLTTAGKAALRGLGWPAAFLGAHANTDGHVTIGPMQYGEGGGECAYPAEADVRDGTAYAGGTMTGTLDLPAEADVKSGVTYDGATKTGTYDPLAAAVFPAEANTLEAEAAYGPTGVEYAGTYHAPDAAEVIDSAVFGPASGTAGTYDTSGAPASPEDIATAVKAALEADGTKLDHLWEMTEDDGGVRRLTANALEQGPSGGLDAAAVRAAVGLASANLDTQLLPLADLAEDTEIATAAATAILATPANKLATDASGRIEVSGTKNTLDSVVAVIPTAIENADALLKRDWTQVTGEAARSVLNALRFLRNKWAIVMGTLTVTKEDDATTAWTGDTGGTSTFTGIDPE